MKSKKFYEMAYIMIKGKVMREWGLEEEDLDEESVEGDVNRETDQRFEDKYGFEYIDIPMNEGKINSLDLITQIK